MSKFLIVLFRLLISIGFKEEINFYKLFFSNLFVFGKIRDNFNFIYYLVVD